MLQIKWLKDYLVFNKKDRVGLACLILIISASIFLPRLLSRPAKPLALKQDPALVLAIDSLQKRQESKPGFEKSSNQYAYRYEPSQQNNFSKGELFEFDPNKLTAVDWQRMGLNEKTSKTIEKYVSKGGKFYRPEDLQKIWGMPEGFYARVKDYVVITSLPRSYPTFESKPFAREERKLTLVSINEADTSSFIALPGIGSKLSARIIGFRERLGGFYSVDQIGETYGLPDSTFQKIRSRLQVDENKIRRINVNTATKDELKVHPYIRWNLANAIVEYRNQHGLFKTLQDLKNIALIDDATFSKIVHYLLL